MRHALQIGTAALVFATQVACFELDTKVTLAADGSGTVATTTLFQRQFIDLLAEMDDGKKDPKAELTKDMPNLDDATKARLAEKGVTVKAAKTIDDTKGIGFSFDMGFASPGSLASAAGVETGEKIDIPLVKVHDLGGGRYELHLDPPETDTDEIVPGPGGDEEESSKSAGKKSKKDMDKAMEAMTKMMEMVKDLRISFAVAVPGTIEEIRPAETGKIEGQSAIWTLDGALMSTLMAGGAPPTDQEMVVIFQMPAGQTLPAAALTAKP